MEELLIQLLGNSPVLIAVLLIYGKFDRRCAVIENEVKHIREEQLICWKKSKQN